MPKIAVIGAGSVVFTKNLVSDILTFPELQDCEFHLMDIDEERLDTAYGLVKRVIEYHKADARVYKTLDRREALKGARYVINSIQVGGLPATLIDFDIPEKYGLRQTIADTHGIGGIFRALRTIPVVVGLARDMEELCPPEAVLLNYSNPMAMVTWAVYEATGINAIGLCHSIQGTARQIASYIGVDYSDLTYRAGGINHIDWFVELKVNGEDAYPQLFAAMKDPETYQKDKVRFEIMKLFGYFVSESSEHMAEYVPYFIKDQAKVEALDIPIREYVRRCEDILDIYEHNKQIAAGERPLPPPSKTVEYASRIIHAIETGDSTTVHGNVRNDGLIENLPRGCCVEVPVLVNKVGLQPTHFGHLPPQLAGVIRPHVAVQDLTVKAALEKRRDYVYQAGLLDPLANSMLGVDQIVAMVDEMIAAHNLELE